MQVRIWLAGFQSPGLAERGEKGGGFNSLSGLSFLSLNSGLGHDSERSGPLSGPGARGLAGRLGPARKGQKGQSQNAGLPPLHGARSALCVGSPVKSYLLWASVRCTTASDFHGQGTGEALPEFLGQEAAGKGLKCVLESSQREGGREISPLVLYPLFFLCCALAFEPLCPAGRPPDVQSRSMLLEADGAFAKLCKEKSGCLSQALASAGSLRAPTSQGDGGPLQFQRRSAGGVRGSDGLGAARVLVPRVPRAVPRSSFRRRCC